MNASARLKEVDADIAGLSRNAGIDRFVDDMEAAGIPPREQIKRLKAYVRTRAATYRNAMLCGNGVRWVGVARHS